MKMGKTSKVLLLVGEIIVIFVVVFAGLFVLMKTIGGGMRKEKQTTGTPVSATPVTLSRTPTPVSGERDLNGLTVTVTNWWDMDFNKPKDEYEQAYWDMQNEAMKKYNYTLVNDSHYDWGYEYTEAFLLGVNENHPIGSIVCLYNNFVAPLLQSNALLDVSKLPSADWNDEKYNQAVIDMMSFNGAIYGFASGMEPRAGVFFNKGMLESCGYSRDLPYELQASGQWDFAHFKELCKNLTRDVDNNGVTDLYAVTAYSGIAIEAFLAANGTSVIVKDGDNGLKLNADDKRVTEALSFFHDLCQEGYYRIQREDETWDYFKECFAYGEVVMLVEEQYQCEDFHHNWNPDLDFGFVTMPKGPSADDYYGVLRENVWVLPNCEAIRSVADDIVFVYDIYTDSPAGMENDDRRWKKNLYLDSLDNRAINETSNWLINKWDYCMPYMDTYIMDWDYSWAYKIGDGKNPQAVLAAYSDEWQQEVDEFNRRMKEIAP
ncbi:MAG: extracellular solute-binding protein [Lachnospiraceae bacterium]|nr:extracellular solute-binding protein [Lachnospiraceae bacterium]